MITYSKIQKLKSNLFDHIFYEIEMYLVTHNYLESGNFYICDGKKQEYDKQLALNLVLEGHQHYARNLIEFFTTKKRNKYDDLRYTDILNNYTELTEYDTGKDKGVFIDKNIGPIWEILNKGVSHMTAYRTKVGLSEMIWKAFDKLYKGDKQTGFVGLPEKISNFLSLLELDNLKENKCFTIDGEEVNHHIKEEFIDEEIQERLRNLRVIIQIQKL